MTYQQFQNEQPTMPAQPQPALSSATGMQQHHNDTTTVVSGGPSSIPAAVVNPSPHNPFLQRAQKTKRLGIAILTIGIITFFFGIIMIFATLNYWISYIGGGIWSGTFIIIAGSLTIGAGANANNYCLRIGAMVMCTFALTSVFSSGILNLVGFGKMIITSRKTVSQNPFRETKGGIGVSCNERQRCYWDGYNNLRCYDYCEYNHVGSIMSLSLTLLNLVVFIITLIATINLGSGCCSSSPNQGAVIIQQGASGYSVTASTNNYHQQQQHQAGGPVYLQPPTYAQSPQQQQYSQAPMQHGCVTYGADYNQQQPQQIPKEEQKIQLDALPSRSGGY